MVTGSRMWPERDAILQALFSVMESDGDNVLVVGDCPSGADAMAKEIAEGELPFRVEVYRADWKRHGKAAGPIRNQAMVDSKPDVCFAFPFGESRGTRDAMSRAHAAGIEVRMVDFGPDGPR